MSSIQVRAEKHVTPELVDAEIPRVAREDFFALFKNFQVFLILFRSSESRRWRW